MSLSKNLKTLEDQLKNAQDKKIILELELEKLNYEYRSLEATLHKAELNQGAASGSMTASGSMAASASMVASGSMAAFGSMAASGSMASFGPMAASGQGSDQGSASGPVPYKTKHCKHFARGNCTKGDDCTFIHELPAVPAPCPPAAFRTKQCTFFAQGNCKNGNNCNFIH